MEARLSFVTLGVVDLQRSVDFYQRVLALPRVPTTPEVAAQVAFFELGRTWLSLYPRDLLAADAGLPAAAAPAAFPGFTLAHNVATPEAVDALLGEVCAAGARLVKAATWAEWGGRSGYFADPDGYLWEVAWNPAFPHLS